MSKNSVVRCSNKQYDIEYGEKMGDTSRYNSITMSTGSLYYIRHIPKHMT